jgi:hypothetical protein
MVYKEDWEESRHRFEALWQREIIDRCCIAVTAPRNILINSNVEYRETDELREKWLNVEYRYNNFINEISHTYYGGEAFPNFWVNLGPGVISSFIGSSYKLGENTVWFDNDLSGNQVQSRQ